MIISMAQSGDVDTLNSVRLIPDPPGSDQTTIVYDGGNDTTLYFNPLPVPVDSIRSIKAAKPFAYAGYLDSLLKAEQDRAKPQQVRRSSDPSWIASLLTSPVTRVVLWILAGCFILFILYRLFLAQGIFRRNANAKTETEPEVAEEVITSESDFEQLIRQAVRAGNFRLAVRYQYLKTLHRLAAKELVAMAPDKTNYQYVTEIKNIPLRKEFSGLTLSYEYVWYGEFSITEPVYQKLEQDYNSFNLKTG